MSLSQALNQFAQNLGRYRWISKEELLESAERYGKSPYGKHLKDVAEGKVVIVPND